MATVINNPGQTSSNEGTGAAGWVVAIVVLVAVIGGLIWWFRAHPAATPAPQNPGASVQVNLPTSNNNNPAPSGGSTGGTGGTQY